MKQIHRLSKQTLSSTQNVNEFREREGKLLNLRLNEDVKRIIGIREFFNFLFFTLKIFDTDVGREELQEKPIISGNININSQHHHFCVAFLRVNVWKTQRS